MATKQPGESNKQPQSERGNAIIRDSPTAGRGLFATRDIPAGDLIFYIQRPLLCVADRARLEDTCANCLVWVNGFSVEERGTGSDPVTLKACLRCKQVKYCSKKCQSQAWKRSHKFECKKWEDDDVTQPKNRTNFVRAVLELLCRNHNGMFSDSEWEGILSLQSHYDNMPLEKRQNVEKQGTLAWHYASEERGGESPPFSEELCCQLISLLITNSLTLVTPSFDPYGFVLDPFPACANHSCDPNAIVVMDSPKISFRALHSIKKDEEIFISYIDVTNPYARRKAELLKRYFFDCQCLKCRKGPVLREDTFLLPVGETTEKLKNIYVAVFQLWKNMGLDTTRIQQPGELKDENVIDTIETGFLDALELDQWAQSPHEGLHRYEDVLQLFHRSEVWPIHRQPYAAVRHDYFVTCLALGKYSQAFFHGLKAYFAIDPIIYPEKHHPLRVVHAFTLSKLAILFVMDAHDRNVDPDGVVEYARQRGHDFSPLIYRLLKEAVENVAKSHGSDNSFARMIRAKYEEVTVDMTRGNPGMLRGIDKAYENSVPFYKDLVERMVKY